MIFDSDEDSRSLIGHVLLKKGKSVYQARSLEEAEKLVVKNQVSIIMLDPMMLSDLKTATCVCRPAWTATSPNPSAWNRMSTKSSPCLVSPDYLSHTNFTILNLE
jgi:hypothetical protein